MTAIERMNRTDLTQRLVNLVDSDTALVAGIGNAGFDLHSVGHRSLNFYMLGSMGQATPIGLGLALAQPERRVVVLEGDGSVLMNLNGLATIGSVAPQNLTLVIWDNASWQITGGQMLSTSATCDLAGVARACGIGNSSTPPNAEEFVSSIRYALDAPGPHAIVAKTDDKPPAGRHHDEPVRIKHEFMAALGVEQTYP